MCHAAYHAYSPQKLLTFPGAKQTPNSSKFELSRAAKQSFQLNEVDRHTEGTVIVCQDVTYAADILHSKHSNHSQDH